MIRKLLLFTVIVVIQQAVSAQEHFITYNNESEKALLNTSQSPAEYIKLALVAEVGENDANSLLKRADDDIKQLNWESTSDQKTEKRLKQLFQKIHAAFLRQYNEKAKFSQLFTTGDYQCVGASILYAYILEQYKIPYQIKETPTHVYVVAYPDSYNILLETTNPTFGYYAPDAKMKANYVQTLVKSKFIDQGHVDQVGIDQAFNEVFYSKTSITLKNAVGLLYYNKSLEKIDANRYADAYSDMAKAEILYPATKHEFLKNDIMNEVLKNSKFDDMKDWEALVYIVNSPITAEDEKKNVEYEFNELIQNKLWKSAQKDKVDEVFAYLTKNLKDSTLRSNIEDNYLMENGRYAYLSHKNAEAQMYLGKEVLKNPNNPLPKSLLVDLITPQFANQSGSVQNIELLNQYTQRFPFMAKDPVIRSIYLYNYAFMSLAAFVQNNGATGDKYMKIMMNEMDNFKDYTQKNDLLVSKVFGKASEYYYRKQGKQKAMEILNTGLKYEPTSEDLLRKIRVFNGSK